MLNRLLLNRLNGGLNGGGGGGSARRMTLAAEPTARSSTLDANPLSNLFQIWANDPASATRVGRYRIGSRSRALAPAAFSNIFTFTRASVGQDFDPTGALTELAVDAIRQSYDPVTLLPAGWLLEGASTNLIANVRGEGGTAGTLGSGGVGPTGWAPSPPAAGLSFDVSFGTEDGLPYVDYRSYGTPSGNNFRFAFNALGAITDGTTYTGSVYARLLAGTLPGALELRMTMPDEIGQSISPTNAPLRLQRFARTRTPSASGGTGRVELRQSLTIGTPVDYTLRFSCPMLEANYFASSIILPAVGTPAATLRNADNLSITGNQFYQIFGNGAPSGFVICDVMLPQLAGAANQVIAQVDDGTNANRLLLFNIAGGSGLWLQTIIASSVVTVAGPAGTVVPGTAFRVGFRWTSAGAISACVNGAAIAPGSGSFPLGLAALRVGAALNGGASSNGRNQGTWAGSYAPSDLAFQNACVYGADVATALRS